MTLPILTERLILRTFVHADGGDILEFISHPSVSRATPEIEATEAGVRAYIDKQNALEPFQRDKCFDLALACPAAGGKVLGLVSMVCEEHRQGAIGWALGIGHRGQGYATEAARALMGYGFEALGLHRIYAKTSSANAASWGVMERLGMRQEAQLCEAERRDGEWVDVLIYGLLAREWKSIDD